MEFNIKLQGYINEADIAKEEFLEQFQEWVESKGWGFTGKVTEVAENEDIEGYIRELASDKNGVFSVYDDGSDEDDSEE
ncbi:hypothetical protein ACFVP8_06460 [Viridibacillus arvi]|uniref:hypothetical protein n=1 Tax=Viridibacillus arvi TaxID=263475 RepID=UPI0036B4E082